MAMAATGFAQVKPLSVGDQSPDFYIENIVDYPKPSARRSDFKTPLLLLQFCTPRCKDCVATAPVLDSLQKKFPGQVGVLLVTYRGADDVEAGKKEKEARRRYPFPFVVNDTALARLFPHTVAPHMVWLDSSGRVKAITGFEEVTEANIRAALEGKNLGLRQKREVPDYDFSRPLFTGNAALCPQPQPVAYAAISRHLEGVRRTTILDSANGYRRLLLVNFSLVYLYNNAVSAIHARALKPKQKIWLAPDSGRYFYNSQLGSLSNWERENFYCYESRLPLAVPVEEQYDKMRRDLNDAFSMDVRLEKRNRKCWILVRAGAALPHPPKAKGVKQKQTLYGLIYSLNKEPALPLVIDETGLPPETELEVEWSTDKRKLNRALRKYGLKLVQKEREVVVYVFAEKAGK